ncbi:MAG: NYN domain-containing protein [Candidatus Saccharicenans sp.]|nr:NYN domain-containing protein [Candidatus Saccharicenans sp.]
MKDATPEKRARCLLIDGYNLIHAIPSIARFVRTDLERARELLLMKLSAHATRNQVKITVVFDGRAQEAPAQNPQPGLTIIFTRGEKADQKIKDLVRKIYQKKEWLVITSDFDIRFQVDGFGVKSRSAHEFAAELEAGTRPRKSPARRPPDQAEEKKMTRKDLDWAYKVFLKNKKGTEE